MRKFFSIFFSLLIVFPITAQLPNGSVAPDFTVQDINGASYSLYSKMGGKAACLDFSATWCGACWQFHQSQALKNLFNNYSSETTILFLEAEYASNTNCLYGPSGCNYITQGDWVTGEPYQIVDLSASNGPSVKGDYSVTYFPTVYVISPDKRTWEIINLSYQELVNWITKSFKLNATATLKNCTCGDNGKITLNPIQGFGTLNYKWSNGATSKDLNNIPGGSYAVTITDQNNYYKSFGPWNITAPPPQVDVRSAQLTHIKCYGESTGSIELQVDYGTPPYFYNWSNGKTTKDISLLNAGSYTVTISDNNGCTRTKSYILYQPTDIVLSTSSLKEDCDELNGFIEVKALGGSPPYLYDLGFGAQQTPEFKDLKGGKEYNITVTDQNNCTEKTKVNLAVTHKPKVNAGLDTSLNCITDIIKLDATQSEKGNNISYLWASQNGNIVSGKESLTPLINKAGNYDLKITDNSTNCVNIDQVIVSDHRMLPNIIVSNDTILNCITTEIELSGKSDSSNVIYFWKKLNDSIFYKDGKTFINSEKGTYVFFVKDTLNLCTNTDTVIVEADQSYPIAKINNSKNLSCLVPEITLDGSPSSQGSDYEYFWTSKSGNILSGANSLYPIVNRGGIYKLIVANNKNYCQSSDEYMLIERTKPYSDFNQSISDKLVHFEDNSSGFPDQWSWDFGDGSVSNEASPSHIYDLGGIYKVCLEISNDCGEHMLCRDIAVGEHAIVKLASFEIQNAQCYKSNDGFIKLNVTGGIAPYTYQWNNQLTTSEITLLSAGDYSVTITDQQGTEILKTFMISEPLDIELMNFNINHSAAGQRTGSVLIDITGGTLPYSFNWNNGEHGNPILSLSPGDYQCSITDAQLCTKTFGPFTVKEITGTRLKNEVVIRFEIIPNPLTPDGTLFIELSDNINYTVEIFNSIGDKILNLHPEKRNASFQLNLENFSNGVFFAVLTLKDFKLYKKFTVNK